MPVTPFVKQLFIGVSPMLASLSVGGAASYPTVLLHQLKANGSSIHLDMDTSTWLGSIHGVAGIPSIFLPTIMQWRGRKFAFITACLITILGWLVAYSATNATGLFISESLHGLGTNSILAVSCLCITEMISPSYRETYIQAYAFLQTLAMALNGLLTQYVHWKTISIIMCVPMVLAVLIACMWPESPYWLALRGEYEKCEKAFIWLRGNDVSSKKELDSIIHSKMEHRPRDQRKMTLRYFWNKITRRDFYIPSLHVFVLHHTFYWTGNYVILIYSIDLIQKTTQNEKVSSFGGFIMNSIMAVGVVIGSILNRYYKKKPIILLFNIFIVITMFSASMVTYLQSVGVVAKDSMLGLYCLMAYMMANSIGVVPFTYPIVVEIMPVKHRGIGGAFIVICSCLFHTTSLKISPYLFLYIDLWGTFLFYSINSMLCGLFIWKYVPETKDRTLQELEYYYMHGDFQRGKSCDSDEFDPMAKEMLTLNTE